MSQFKKSEVISALMLAAITCAGVWAMATDPDKEVIGPIFAPANNGKQV